MLVFAWLLALATGLEPCPVVTPGLRSASTIDCGMKIRVTNKSGRSVTVLFVDASGQEVRSFPLLADASRLQRTCAGHVWRARATKTNRLLAELRVGKAETDAAKPVFLISDCGGLPLPDTFNYNITFGGARGGLLLRSGKVGGVELEAIQGSGVPACMVSPTPTNYPSPRPPCFRGAQALRHHNDAGAGVHRAALQLLLGAAHALLRLPRPRRQGGGKAHGTFR